VTAALIAEDSIEILRFGKFYVLPSSPFQEDPCIFQQNNAKPHSAHVTKAWLQKKRILAINPDLSPIECVTYKQLMQQQLCSVGHLKTY